MDNRYLLASLNLSQQAWGRLCGCNPRTAQKWFEAGAVTPVLVNRLLRFFVAHPNAFSLFQKFITKATNMNTPQPLPVERIAEAVNKAMQQPENFIAAFIYQNPKAKIEDFVLCQQTTACGFKFWIEPRTAHPRPDARALEVVSSLVEALEEIEADDYATTQKHEKGTKQWKEGYDDGVWVVKEDVSEVIATARQYINEMKG